MPLLSTFADIRRRRQAEGSLPPLFLVRFLRNAIHKMVEPILLTIGIFF